MINTDRHNVRILVINSNTGKIVRNEEILTDKLLSRIARRYATKESIVITSIDDSIYCFYINNESYFCKANNDIVIINFF